MKDGTSVLGKGNKDGETEFGRSPPFPRLWTRKEGVSLGTNPFVTCSPNTMKDFNVRVRKEKVRQTTGRPFEVLIPVPLRLMSTLRE